MSLLIVVLTFIVIIIIAFKIYTKVTIGWCKSYTSLAGKTTIVTGANTGIGYNTALDFAKRGAKVILACRDQKRADEARTKIIKETDNQNVVVKLLDLASFDSVRAFAEYINRNEDRLDILVNNAAVIGTGDKKCANGQQLLMQVNYFSPFLLTILLLGLLKKSTPSRVVNVSSGGASFATNFTLDKINKYSSDFGMYTISKLCNILFTKELAKRLEGTGVTTYSLHPGLVKTEILRDLNGILGVFNALLMVMFGKTSEEGAQTTIYCSLTKGIEKYNGEHFDDCRKVSPYKTVTASLGLSRKLWKLSEEVVYDYVGASENTFN